MAQFSLKTWLVRLYHAISDLTWAEVQKAIYAETPSIKIGDFNALSAQTKKLEGVTPAPWPYFWNAYLKQ